MKNKILNWIKENEFDHHQGGYLIHADDLEAFINKIFSSEKETESN